MVTLKKGNNTFSGLITCYFYFVVFGQSKTQDIANRRFIKKKVIFLFKPLRN